MRLAMSPGRGIPGSISAAAAGGRIPPSGYCAAAITQSCNGEGAAAAGGVYPPLVLLSAAAFVLHLCAGSAAAAGSAAVGRVYPPGQNISPAAAAPW